MGSKTKSKQSRGKRRELKHSIQELINEDRESHRVRYIAQEDMSGYARKRWKWGLLEVRYFLSLEGCTMSIFKERNGPPKYEFNVRNVKVLCERTKTGALLIMHLGERVLQFVLEDGENLDKWKRALDAAVTSDIEEYYQFGSALGRGAFGEVVEGYHRETNEKRAIKIIQRSRDGIKEQHLLQEIQVLKEIDHVNIVRTYEIFNLKKTIYIVMEHVSGGDLFDFVSKHNTLSEAQASQVMKSLLEATLYLHERQIVHRDLKPENILCVNESWPLSIKVTDFGFAAFADDRNLMTTSVGTAYFIAPEIITKRGYGTPVDLYACGVILYTILTGRLPFPGRNLTDYFRNVVEGDVRFPLALWKGISPAAQSFVRALLQVEPDKRLTSFAALKHSWIDSDAPRNSIKRDRSSLHHSNRKLLKPRAAYVVVSVVHKVKRIHEIRYGLAKIPNAIDAVEKGAKRTAGAVEKGAKRTVGVVEKGAKKTVDAVEKGAKKTVHGVERGAKRTGRGAKRVGRGIGRGIRRPHVSRFRADSSREARGAISRRGRIQRVRKLRAERAKEPPDIAPELKNPQDDNGCRLSHSDRNYENHNQSPTGFTTDEDRVIQRGPSGGTTKTQSSESFVAASTSLNLRRVKDPDCQNRAVEHALGKRDGVSEAAAMLTSAEVVSGNTGFAESGIPRSGNPLDIHDALNPPNISAGEDVRIQMDKPPPGLLRLLQKARRKHLNDKKEQDEQMLTPNHVSMSSMSAIKGIA